VDFDLIGKRPGSSPLEEPYGKLYTPTPSDDSLTTRTGEAVAQILLQSNLYAWI